jgi:hypothetical protein
LPRFLGSEFRSFWQAAEGLKIVEEIRALNAGVTGGRRNPREAHFLKRHEPMQPDRLKGQSGECNTVNSGAAAVGLRGPSRVIDHG